LSFETKYFHASILNYLGHGRRRRENRIRKPQLKSWAKLRDFNKLTQQASEDAGPG
jgi:hypothetical protein